MDILIFFDVCSDSTQIYCFFKIVKSIVMKKLLVSILFLTAFFSCFAYDFSAVCSTGQTLCYNITSDTTVDCVGYADSVWLHGTMTIPNSVMYNGALYHINGISNFAFRDCSITTLIISDSVKMIGQYSFYNCGIDSLYLGESLDSINSCAFLANNISYLYYGCKNCIIPYGTFYIAQVWSCNNEPNIPYLDYYNQEGGHSYDAYASPCYTKYWRKFYYQHNPLYSLRNSLQTLVIGEMVESLPYSFDFCNNIATLEYLCKHTPNGWNHIPKSYNILRIGNSVQDIASNAFENCHQISGMVSIPNSVTFMGDHAFAGCVNIDSLKIGNGLDSIPPHSFEYCRSLRSIIIPNNIVYIGESAFQHCVSVSELKLGDAVSTIATGAFMYDSSITRVVIPDRVSNIGEYAFAYNTEVSCVKLGKGVRFIGTGAFTNCISIDSILFNSRKCMQMDGALVFSGCNIQHITIGNNVQRYPDRAFTPFTTLFDSLPTPDSLKYIGEYCFANNILSMDSIVLMQFDTIAAGAFFNCENIHSIITDARYVGDNAFSNCNSLISATFFDVKNVGRGALANCDRLVSVNLGDSVRTIGAGAFSGDFRLQTVTMGDNITSMGDSVFQGCVRLTRPELPANLQTIGTRAFGGCSEINGKLTFPAGVTSIGDYAFNGVGTISEIEMLGSNPPTIYAHTFNSVSNTTPVLVPCGAVMNYYTTNYWENFSNIVEAPPFKLTVGSNDEGMGTVAITQQPTCNNHTARISATAETGYHFLRWDDGNTTNPRQLNMTQDSIFTAIFVQNNSYITVEANNPLWGTVSGTGNYSYNAPVTLTATAYDGYHFLKWNDGNTQNPRYMAAICDTSFTAIFVSNVSTITVSNANPDWGNVSGSGVYYYQNLVSITATPVYGYHFAQWNDGNTLNPRTIVVEQDSSFTAYFAVNTYSIVGTSNSTAMGSVSGGGNYTYLHEMSLTATPAFGYHFEQWNDQNTDNPRTITVTRDSSFTAQFAANSYSITSEPNDPTMGSSYGSGIYSFNTTATLTAVAEYGYHFTQWSDGVTDNPRTVTVQNSATYTAQFEINSYILTVQSSNPAIGTTSGGGSYNYLTPVNIEALPNAGYHFTQWSDGNTDNPRLVSITQNATYTAQFAINSYAVGVVSNNTNMGSVTGSGTYNHNSTATLTATAYYGYHFVQWQDGNTENPRNVVVTDSTQYTAEFTYNSYLVTANSSNVTLGSATGGGSYNYLSQVALTAIPVPHYHFTMWNDSIEDNPRTVIVTRDSIFTAHFSIDRHTIGVSTSDAVRGLVGGSDTVDYGTSVWITATANYGYHFTQWNDGNTNNSRRVVVSQDTAFTASFDYNQYTATCMVNDTMRGAVTHAGGSYNYLTSLTFTAVPGSNYHFLRWSNADQSGYITDNPITFTLTQDTTFTAIFVGLTASSDNIVMGTATHAKQSNLVELMTATANYGYHFVQWNDSVTTNPRTVTLSSDTAFTATFSVNQYHLTLACNDSTLGTVLGTGWYDYLTSVTISATAAPHSHFVQWNDGNTTNPRQVTLTSDSSFTALFESDPMYHVAVTANDTTRGSVTGDGSYYAGETATIGATANDHYYFAQWSDGNTSNPRVVTVIESITYTAVFEPVSYSVTVTANDYTMGSVSGTGIYPYGSTATAVAQPFDNYRFVEWSDGVTETVRNITVTEDLQLEAQFADSFPDGIDDVEGCGIRVYVHERRIVVEGVGQQYRIYDITGRLHAHNEQLPMGVYFVQVGRWTKKVVVL